MVYQGIILAHIGIEVGICAWYFTRPVGAPDVFLLAFGLLLANFTLVVVEFWCWHCWRRWRRRQMEKREVTR